MSSSRSPKLLLAYMLIFIRKCGTPAILPLITNGANMALLSPRGKALSSNVQYFLLTRSRVNMSLLSRSLVMLINGRTCHYYPDPFFMTSLVRWFVSWFLQSYKTKLVRKISKIPFGGGIACLARTLLGLSHFFHITTTCSRFPRYHK